ncbi:ATP-grasp domain-containing protein, partial [Paenibacillus sonchi]
KVGSLAELTAAAAELGLPCVLKTATGGYDGKGQAVIRQPEELEAAFRQVAPGASAGGALPELVLEKFVPFKCEISVVAARSASGEVKSFPAAE